MDYRKISEVIGMSDELAELIQGWQSTGQSMEQISAVLLHHAENCRKEAEPAPLIPEIHILKAG